MSPEAERELIQLWRQATPEQKFKMMSDATTALRQSMMAELRERHPDDSPERLRRRFADLWLGPDLARRAYGEWPKDGERV